MDRSELSVLSLCSGIAGLDLGVELALGGRARVVGYVEREAVSAAVLLARMEAQALAPAPVWCADLEGFDGTEWNRAVDLVTAGFPCPPFSVAGKRLANNDARWIWPDIARILKEVDPPLVLLENVPGLLSVKPSDELVTSWIEFIREVEERGLDRVPKDLVRTWGLGTVHADLARLGYSAEWGVFSASEAGAPHLRKRLFVLARRVPHPLGDPLRILSERGAGTARQADPRDTESGEVGEHLETGKPREVPRRGEERESVRPSRGQEPIRGAVADGHGRRLPGQC